MMTSRVDRISSDMARVYQVATIAWQERDASCWRALIVS
jgi:hypothetical protein